MSVEGSARRGDLVPAGVDSSKGDGERDGGNGFSRVNGMVNGCGAVAGTMNAGGFQTRRRRRGILVERNFAKRTRKRDGMKLG
jgi:hypothetical protein